MKIILWSLIIYTTWWHSIVLQNRKAVTDYFQSKELLPDGFAHHNTPVQPLKYELKWWKYIYAIQNSATQLAVDGPVWLFVRNNELLALTVRGSTLSRRQILTSKVDPRTVRVNYL